MTSAVATRRPPSLSPPPPAKRQRLEFERPAPLISIESNTEDLHTEPHSKEKPVLPPATSFVKCTSHLNYRNGVVFAPMVRSGTCEICRFILSGLEVLNLCVNTVPSRLLALKYGADLVWGPEIVDRAMIGCERIVDGTCCNHGTSGNLNLNNIVPVQATRVSSRSRKEESLYGLLILSRSRT